MDHEASAASRLRTSALDLLLAIDEGRAAGPVARALAVEVLRSIAPDSPPWAAAITVLEGGPLRMRRAVDLAGLVVEHFGEPDQAEADECAG